MNKIEMDPKDIFRTSFWSNLSPVQPKVKYPKP
jgi:hypothetical protein